jgi:hypothetical protein
MQTLAREIESALQTQKCCFVRPEELQRVWPSVGAEHREHIVREFARDHGWRIFSYSRMLGAMFVRDTPERERV